MQVKKGCNMKMFSYLKTSVFFTMALAAVSAQAEFQGQPSRSSKQGTPVVQIISPLEGAVFLAGEEIQVAAQAHHFTNALTGVEFFAGTNSLGVVSNALRHSDVYYLDTTNLDAGVYVLTAVATDTSGNSVTSVGVDISVVTNFPPKVRLVAPCNGAVILGPTNVTISAVASDEDGTVATVEFFEGTNSLGIVPTPAPVYVTNWFGVFTIKEPYTLVWSNVTEGAYSLTAVAADNAGVTSTSAPVSITVVTDLPPVVHIVTPANGTSFPASATINVSAVASDASGSVASVEFFAGTNSLGLVTTPVVVTNFWRVESYYTVAWSNAPVGTNVLTAVATDTAGSSTTSAPVTIRVVPPPSPKVQITSPFNGETFYHAPTTINVSSYERNFTNPVVLVQFFANGTGIGTATNSPFNSIVWTNVTAGAYTLTAIATDSESLNTTSAPVSITVSTNRTPGWWGH